MKIKTFSYRDAEDILTNQRNISVYKEIINVCEQAPLPVFKGKSKDQPNLDVIQQILNTYFRLAFTKLSWEPEPKASPDTSLDDLASDFRKMFILESDRRLTLQIEVEFGNAASSYRNYFKFQLSYSHGLTDICILILPTDKLCRRIDSGVANFEKTVREIPSAKLSFTMPILIIGLDDTDVVEWDVKSEQPDLSIVKGDNKSVKAPHEELVKMYMHKISNK